MGITSQRKGRTGERELAEIFRSVGIPATPGRPVSYGAEPDIVGVPGIHPEVKRVERLNVSEAMKQAIQDSERFGDGVPCLFHRKNREPWLVTMRLSDWLQMYGGDNEREVF